MIYLDACLVIYLVEEHSVFAPLIEKQILKASSTQFAISPLTITEALVMPIRQNNQPLLSKYQAFFEQSLILPLPDAVFMDAAILRAKHIGLKTPDALHLAAAQFHQCLAFWTNDDRLYKVAGDFAINISAGML